MSAKQYLNLSGLTVYDEEIKEYITGKASPTFTGTKEAWDALTSQEKAGYVIVNLTNDYDVGAKIDDTTPALNKVYSSQKIENTFAKKADMPVWTSGVQALTGATSCTITNNAISSSSVLEVFFENTSSTDPVAKVTGVSGTTATISFDALAEDTTFYLRVTNL